MNKELARECLAKANKHSLRNDTGVLQAMELYHERLAYPIIKQTGSEQEDLWKELDKMIRDFGMTHYITKDCIKHLSEHFIIQRR